MPNGGKNLTLRIGDDEACIAFHDPRQSEGAGFARAAAAEGKDVQISSVLMSVHAEPDVLGQWKALLLFNLCVDLLRRTPLCGAVFLALPEVRSRSEVHDPAERIYGKAQQKRSWGALTPFNRKWRLHVFHQSVEHIEQAPAETRRKQKREPYSRQKENPIEYEILLLGVSVFHVRTLRAPCRAAASENDTAQQRPCHDRRRPPAEHISYGKERQLRCKAAPWSVRNGNTSK